MKSKPKQRSFIPKNRKDHGGSLAVKRRRSRRPLNMKQSHHVTLKSYHAIGVRSLFKHKKMILALMKKNALKFNVKVYEYAVQGNHLHLLVKAQNRDGLQNFFRVFAGHSAQRILEKHPFESPRGGAPGAPGSAIAGGAPKPSAETRKGCEKNRRKFWSYLLYSRVVSWGREFARVAAYIRRNTLELLNLIAYQPRKRPQDLRNLQGRANQLEKTRSG